MDDGRTMQPAWQANGKRPLMKLVGGAESFCQGYRTVWKHGCEVVNPLNDMADKGIS
jgi:hypothetical protein